MSDPVDDGVTLNPGVGGSTIAVEAIPDEVASTTIAAASTGVSLPQATINVASSIGFSATGGTALVVTTTGIQIVTYTGIAAGQLTGCTGGSGQMTTGNPVSTAKLTEVVKIMLGTAGVNGGYISPTNGLPTVLYDQWGNPVSDPNGPLDRIEALLTEIRDREESAQRVIIVDSQGVQSAVKNLRTVARDVDAASVNQISPNQLPIPVQAAPLGASAFQYMGYAVPSTSLSLVCGPFNEIFSNVAAPSIVSNSAADGVGGTGMRRVAIVYYDQDLNGPYQIVVNLNGVTAVNLAPFLVAPLCYVEMVYGLEFGSGGRASGNIFLDSAAGGTGTTIAQINSGDAQTFFTKHYIPAGVTCYLTGLALSLSSAGIVNGNIAGIYNFNSGDTGLAETQPQINLTGYFGWNVGGNANFPSPIALPGPAKVFLQGIASVTTGVIYGTMSGYDLPSGLTPGRVNPLVPPFPNYPPVSRLQ